ncbi:porin family protein [Bacteroidia bacterium]|nr:porin family protein [Bacteroidia bacterium]
MKQIILALLLIFSLNTFAQKFGIQFYQGVNKPLVSFSGSQGDLDYQSNFNSDTRIGIFYGDLSKLSVGTLIGASTVKATAKNDDLTTSFSQSSLRVDIPVRYAIPPIYKQGKPIDFFISSVALVPSYGFVTESSQSVNGLDSRTEELFNKTNFYLGTEINFMGYTSDKLAIHPYISYRYMLSNADLDSDDLKINEFSLGLRMDINK